MSVTTGEQADGSVVDPVAAAADTHAAAHEGLPVGARPRRTPRLERVLALAAD